jgi:hypothetical protein
MSRRVETDLLVRGGLEVHTVPAQASAASKFLTLDAAVATVKYRTAAQMLTDIGAAAATITLDDVLSNGNISTESITVGGLAVNGSVAFPNIAGGVLKVDANGNVFSDATQTIDITDYNYDIIGARDGANKLFKLRFSYIENTTKVFLNGVRLTLGLNYDYDETLPDAIFFNVAPVSADLITVDYKITVP